MAVRFNINTVTPDLAVAALRDRNRADKAAQIPDSDIKEVAPDIFEVKSQSREGLKHEVDLRGKGSCTCEDWTRNIVECKHLKAARAKKSYHEAKVAWAVRLGEAAQKGLSPSKEKIIEAVANKLSREIVKSPCITCEVRAGSPQCYSCSERGNNNLMVLEAKTVKPFMEALAKDLERDAKIQHDNEQRRAMAEVY